MKRLLTAFFCMGVWLVAGQVQADTRFDVITFNPAPEGGNYFSVHDSDTFKAWQGHIGLYLDYANRPLQFTGQGTLAGQRQSIVDHIVTANVMGALGFTDWFTFGVNVPGVAYNWFHQDSPLTNPTGTKDHGPDMGDIEVDFKFRLLNVDKYRVGIALIPYVTLPTGNPETYTGAGVIAGGGTLVVDFKPIDRLEFSINAGALFREGMTRTYTFNLTGGGTATDTIRIDDQLTFGAAMNFKITPNFHAILEAYGATELDDIMGSRVSPFEAGGGMRYFIGDTGLALGAGGTLGILDGVGKPRFRAFATLNWYSPDSKPCPVCKDPEPQKQVIIDNKFVLWGKIFFDTAKATIKPVSFPILDDVADVINSNPDIKLVEIQGHTDWRGTDSYNLKLSQRRSESAMRYLIAKGVDPNRLRAVGYGETQPIASNNTQEGMSQNRRTEFIVIETYSGKVINPSTKDGQ